jgi:hypothetical protein
MNSKTVGEYSFELNYKLQNTNYKQITKEKNEAECPFADVHVW